jgi:hypothetical protein
MMIVDMQYAQSTQKTVTQIHTDLELPLTE